MGPYDDINFFTQYQTFIVGALGFSGVIMTLWWNARLAREGRAEVVRHEQASLRTALIEELKLIKRTFEIRIGQLARRHEQDEVAFLPMRMTTVVYDRLVDRIGLLSGTEIAAVIPAYLLVQQLSERIRLIAPPQGSHTDKDYFAVTNKILDKVRKIHESYLVPISNAIEQLEANLRTAR